MMSIVAIATEILSTTGDHRRPAQLGRGQKGYGAGVWCVSAACGALWCKGYGCGVSAARLRPRQCVRVQRLRVRRERCAAKAAAGCVRVQGRRCGTSGATTIATATGMVLTVLC